MASACCQFRSSRAFQSGVTLMIPQRASRLSVNVIGFLRGPQSGFLARTVCGNRFCLHERRSSARKFSARPCPQLSGSSKQSAFSCRAISVGGTAICAQGNILRSDNPDSRKNRHYDTSSPSSRFTTAHIPRFAVISDHSPGVHLPSVITGPQSPFPRPAINQTHQQGS